MRKISGAALTLILLLFKEVLGDVGLPPEPVDDRWSLHYQSTVVTQYHGAMHSFYAGPDSFSASPDNETSISSTLFTGVRLWNGSELYVNPEVVAGQGLSDGAGLGGFTDGDTNRTNVRPPRAYLARAFIQQHWGWGRRQTTIGSGQNQIAEHRDLQHIVLTFGKLAASDLFDVNTYAHDPRTQFLNYGFMTNVAWDYPADVRGYTWGTALEYAGAGWAARVGSFLLPTIPNGAQLDTQWWRHQGTVAELEQSTSFGARPGRIRLLGYLNQADIADYHAAMALSPVEPTLIPLRRTTTRKYGWGLNFEESLTDNLGLFSRCGWNDGHTETWNYTEADRTASLGVSLKGAAWKRSDDVVGLAFLANGLSADHRAYLEAGGAGFQLGDRGLTYSWEKIVEGYYAWKIISPLSLTFDVQTIVDPGYNRDRGPVVVWSGRLHLEL